MTDSEFTIEFRNAGFKFLIKGEEDGIEYHVCLVFDDNEVFFIIHCRRNDELHDQFYGVATSEVHAMNRIEQWMDNTHASLRRRQ